MFAVTDHQVSGKLTKRKEFRLRDSDAELIAAAAASVGLQESEFIRQAVIREAGEVTRQTRMTVLADRDFDAFRKALAAPTRKLPGLATAARHSEGILTDG